MKHRSRWCVTLVSASLLCALCCSRGREAEKKDEAARKDEADATLEKSVPSGKEILALGEETRFRPDAATEGPALPAQLRSIESSKTRLRVYFSEGNMSALDRKLGAVVAKLECQGIPSVYNIPDGTYYLWAGYLDKSLRAEVTRVDGTVQTEVMIDEVDSSVPSDTVTTVENTARASVPFAQIPRPGPPPRPPNGSLPKPPPPPKMKWVIRRICVPTNGKMEYRNGRFCVPAS